MTPNNLIADTRIRRYSSGPLPITLADLVLNICNVASHGDDHADRQTGVAELPELTSVDGGRRGAESKPLSSRNRPYDNQRIRHCQSTYVSMLPRSTRGKLRTGVRHRCADADTRATAPWTCPMPTSDQPSRLRAARPRPFFGIPVCTRMLQAQLKDGKEQMFRLGIGNICNSIIRRHCTCRVSTMRTSPRPEFNSNNVAGQDSNRQFFFRAAHPKNVGRSFTFDRRNAKVLFTL